MQEEGREGRQSPKLTRAAGRAPDLTAGPPTCSVPPDHDAVQTRTKAVSESKTFPKAADSGNQFTGFPDHRQWQPLCYDWQNVTHSVLSYQIPRTKLCSYPQWKEPTPRSLRVKCPRLGDLLARRGCLCSGDLGTVLGAGRPTGLPLSCVTAGGAPQRSRSPPSPASNPPQSQGRKLGAKGGRESHTRTAITARFKNKLPGVRTEVVRVTEAGQTFSKVPLKCLLCVTVTNTLHLPWPPGGPWGRPEPLERGPGSCELAPLASAAHHHPPRTRGVCRRVLWRSLSQRHPCSPLINSATTTFPCVARQNLMPPLMLGVIHG